MVTSLFGSEDRSKRQIVTFDEIPKDLVNAVIAIEDRRFFQHSGVNLLPPDGSRRHRHYSRPPRPGRLDAHHAALARVLPDSRKDHEAQAHGNADRHRPGAEVLQAAHLRDVRQPGADGPARLLQHQRLRRGLARLLRQGHQGPDAARSAPCSPASFSVPAICRPTVIPSAPWSAATWCSTPWSRPAPSPASRPIAPRPLR